MRALAIWALLTSLALQASASPDRVNIEQLESALTASQGRSDSQIAEQLSGFELTERLSELHLAHLEASLPGPKSRKRLSLLADSSAFLDIPPSELPPTPEPSHATQVSLLGLARDYVAKTILKLPNFFATRETTSYVSRSADTRINSMNTISFKPFEEIDASNVTVLYRDGHELAAKGEKYHASSKEVRTRGEFGPILIVLLDDMSKGKVIWSHWEQSVTGLLAVFRYEVPQPASHYLVTSPGVTAEGQYYPSYHGEIALNPANGSILRLTVVPEMKPGDPMTSADLMVEYAPVEIGGASYICPVRSVALSHVRVVKREMDDQWDLQHTSLGPPQTYLNEVRFTRYHLFRSEVRIVAANDAENDGVPDGRNFAEDNAAPISNQPPSAAPATSIEPERANISPLPSGGLQFRVDELEQGLSRDKTNGVSDEEIAQHLSKIQLTERLSGVRLTRIEAELLSPVDHQALKALVDASAFRDLPETDIPDRPVPEKSAQATMLAAATNYVAKTLPSLPGLFATRKTTCFSDATASNQTAPGPLRRTSEFSTDVSYINGHESAVNDGKQKQHICNFQDIGEIAPSLPTLLPEALTGELSWSHWEHGVAGLQAVFAYAIPEQSSHSAIASSQHDPGKTAPDPGGGLKPQHHLAYRGEISIDPSDGSIRRFTAMAELEPDGPIERVDSSIEFGPVEIRKIKYICPQESVALYRVRSASHTTVSGVANSKVAPSEPAVTYLVDGVFMKYHIVR